MVHVFKRLPYITKVNPGNNIKLSPQREVNSNGIHLIEKTLSLEKYKPWTMGPNELMGTTLLASQI